MANYVSKGYTTPAGVDSREDVRQWQQRLGVTADGIWGKNTQAAYQQWQRDIRNSSAGSNPTAPASTSGSRQSGASYSTGATKQQLTAQQKNAAFSGNWLERIGNTLSNLTGGMSAAGSLPSLQPNYGGMVMGAAAGKTASRKNSKDQLPMHGLGVNGIGARVNGQQQANTTPKRPILSRYQSMGRSCMETVPAASAAG